MTVHALRPRPMIPLALAAFAALACMAWSDTSLAAQACLRGNSINKLCVDLTADPGDSVQPSDLAGTKTYVKYKASLTNVVQATSKNIELDLTFSPAPSVPPDVTADSGIACTTSGATVTCLLNKLDGYDPMNVTVVVQSPTSTGSMSATGTIGWNGNTASTAQTVAVTNTAGRSYVPANKVVTLATSNDSDVTPDHPLWAAIAIDAQPHSYTASISIVNNAVADANCAAGIYLSPTYGGPYLCRDLDHPTRAVRVDVGDTFPAAASLTKASPGHMTMKWDASLVQAAQLPPNPPAAPTGLPPFAQFVTYDDIATPSSPAYAAISKRCGADVPAPCLVNVARLSGAAEGDWQVDSLETNDGTRPVWLAQRASPMDALYAVLDFIITPAEAQVTLPLKINAM